jgi:hypothetical protein
MVPGGGALELDIETVRLRIIVQLHWSLLAEPAIEESIVDGLAVAQRYDA